MAVDAPPDSDEHYVRSVQTGVFRTQENALEPSWHESESNVLLGEGGADWRPTGFFETTQLPAT